MHEDFESFNESDDDWLTELEISDTDIENDLFDWHEAEAGELPETSYGEEADYGRDAGYDPDTDIDTDAGYGRDGTPRRTREPMMRDGRANGVRAQPRQAPSRRTQSRQAPPRQAPPREAPPREAAPRQAPPRYVRPRQAPPEETLHHVIDDEDLEQDDMTIIMRTGGTGRGGATAGTGTRAGWPESPYRPPAAEDRTQALIDRGRRSAGRRRMPRSRKIVFGVAGLVVVIVVASLLIFRSDPSWPPSVATVKNEIATACQNPNVASEPGQVNFACGKTTSQILWVFALMTSGDNPQFTDAKTGRQGLEPITPAQGGEVAWSLNLHHPYNPNDAVDSLAVAARAINNIIGGATVTGSNGKPVVQPGLESNPANCVKYTGSSAVVSHAGFPSLCAQPVTSGTGQAALVADTYQQWVVGATPAAAYDVSVLFSNADDPGNAQVQAILKTLPGAK